MNKKELFVSLLLIILLAIIFLPFASKDPDGLEKVAQDKGFSQRAVPSLLRAPLSEYLWPSIKNEKLATAMAGIFGILVLFGFGFGSGALIRRRRRDRPPLK